MTNKEIVKQTVDAFLKWDLETALSHMTEDVVMGWAGFFDLAPGKDAVREFFKETPETLDWKIGDFIDGGDKIVSTGWIKSKHEGEIKECYFCDIYTLENGKIKNLTGYMVFAQPKG